MTWYNMLLFFLLLLLRESARSIGHRSDTLTTHIPIYHNNHSYYKTILERFYYKLNILDSSQLSPFCIGSMGESGVNVKFVHSISIEKYVLVLEGVDI